MVSSGRGTTPYPEGPPAFAVADDAPSDETDGREDPDIDASASSEVAACSGHLGHVVSFKLAVSLEQAEHKSAWPGGAGSGYQAEV